MTNEPDRLLRVEDVAQILSVEKRTVYRMVAAGTLPKPVRFSRKMSRWKASVIQKYLESLQPDEGWKPPA